MQVPYGGELRFEPLVSCKVAICEDRTEGSRTTNPGTDEHFFVKFYEIIPNVQ